MRSLFWAPYEVFCSLECDLSYSLRFAPHHVEHLVGMNRTLQADLDQLSPPPLPKRLVSVYRPPARQPAAALTSPSE